MDLRKSKFILPNLFTISSVLFGMVAVVSCLEGTAEAFREAALAILVAGLADGLDGRVARLTRTETKFGVQLDSLADVLSFGMAPAVLAYAFALKGVDGGDGFVGLFLAFLYVSCGALRLARFNVQADRAHGPTGYFTGLPIPAAAGIVATLTWACVDLGIGDVARTLAVGGALTAVALLMVSTVRYRNFKHVHLGWLGKLVFVGFLGLLLLAVFETKASVVLLGLGALYLALGPFEWFGALVWRLARPPRRPARPRKPF
jgi:CDP-diacylglycerol---serine O-phosphatidyltransferase